MNKKIEETKKIIKTKKQKIIGTQNYINQDTGEIVETLVIEKNIEQDFNFHKVWINDLMNIFELIGTKRIKIINYLLKEVNDKNNIVFFTQRKLSKELDISLVTINETIKILVENNFMKQIQRGVYQINPDIIIKGNSTKRKNLLIKYNEIKKEE